MGDPMAEGGESPAAVSQAAVSQNMPEAEIEIDEALVRRLLLAAAEQQRLDPGLAAQPLEMVANGWDNVMYRLGAEHLVRLPRRQVAAPLIKHEQRWLPELASRLPIPIPVPVFAGRPVNHPNVYYPWSWSIVPWFDGQPLGTRGLDVTESTALARSLADFLQALHAPSPLDVPANPFRGVPLSTRADRTWSYLENGSPAMQAVGSDRSAEEVRNSWTQALEAPDWDRHPRWLHGDLHALNLVWNKRRDGSHLAAVIDFGDITGGDPATDLAVAWSLFPDPVDRARFQSMARIDGEPVDEATWSRARGWALAVAAAVVTRSADNPVLYKFGSRTLRSVAGMVE